MHQVECSRLVFVFHVPVHVLILSLAFVTQTHKKISMFAGDERAEGHLRPSVDGGVWGHLRS